MIKKVFYNIEKEKRENIINAGKKEIILNGLEGAKVVNICKSANIQRSAFYRYFDSIDDLFEEIIVGLKKQKEELFRSEFLKSKGDVISLLKRMLILALENEYDILLAKSLGKSKEFKSRFSYLLKPLINKATLMKNKDLLTIQMGQKLIRQLTIEYQMLDLDKEFVVQRFDEFLEIIELGYKEK